MRIPREAQLGELFAKRDNPPPTTSTPPSSTSTASSSPTTSSTSSPTPSPTSSSGSGNTKTVAIVVAILVVLLILGIAVFFFLRRAKRRNASPRYVPGTWLKEKWRNWSPKSHVSIGTKSYSSSLQRSERSLSTPGDNNDTNDTPGPQRRNRTETQQRRSRPLSQRLSQRLSQASNLARNTSLRSIMTLPAYTSEVRENEEVLGREGERGGIDTVVEFPETIDEEEARREDEMESLYQIRLQRRRENAAREERRRMRREARSRGDAAEVERLRRESRRIADTHDPLSATAMIIEHQSKPRDRRVSSVSYAGAGLARHDGTRIRAGSTDSDRNPLLSSAASMSASTSTLRGVGGHRRDISEVSILSGASTAAATSRRGSEDQDYEVITLTQTRTRSSSHAPSAAGSDVGEARIPLVDPPEYEQLEQGFEEAPPYESPVDSRRSWLGLPRIETLPSIEVTISSPAVERGEGEVIGEEARRRESGAER